MLLPIRLALAEFNTSPRNEQRSVPTPAVAAQFAAKFTGETKPTAAGKPINHVCLAMDRAEFDALAARLDAAGVQRHRIGDSSYGARGSSKHWFYFQDPDGNVIEARHYE